MMTQDTLNLVNESEVADMHNKMLMKTQASSGSTLNEIHEGFTGSIGLSNGLNSSQ